VSAERAAALCDLLEAHARRVYACSTAEKLRAARSLLAKIQAGKLTSPFTSREIYKSGWAGLTEREVVEEALTTLVGHGWLRAIKVEQPGRPLVVYHAHPDAMTRTVDLGVLGVTVSRNPELPSASRAAQKKGV